MAGRLISILSKQSFTLNFASGGTGIVALTPKILDARDAVSGVLTARVSAVTTMPAGSSVQIGLVNAYLMPDDPATIYNITSSGQIVALTIAATDSGFPRLYAGGFTASSSPPCGAMVAVGMSAIYGGTAGTATITLGVELLIRDS